MDFYGQHTYDEESESEAIHWLDMKVNALAQQYWWDLKPMILAKEQDGQSISPSLEEEFNNLMQSLQQAWDEATTFPSYHKIVERYEFSDDFSSVASEDEETEDEEEETIKGFFMQPNQQTMKEYFMQHPKQASKKTIQAIEDSHPNFSWSYNKVNTYEQPISQPSSKSESEEFPSQTEQEEAITIPYYIQEELSSKELDELLDWVQYVFGDAEEVEKEEIEEKARKRKMMLVLMLGQGPSIGCRSLLRLQGCSRGPFYQLLSQFKRRVPILLMLPLP
ncbi:hypothetical protein QYF36_013786 [Acer negundo]|nr:hypothetical protein QYF36_013786 [Acer negundo]